MTSLLLVEDDEHLRTALRLSLRARGYTVHDAATGATALDVLGRKPVDLVLLDLGLPDMDGLAVLRRLRDGDPATPVIVVSARRDQADKVGALDSGADDYMTKPFGLDELLARIRAALRRSAPPADRVSVTTPDFTVDLGRKTVRRADGTEVHLTPTEWGVLETLVLADGLLVAGADLLRAVWGPGHETDGHYLRVYLAQLRRKLEPEPARPRYLLTAPGLGYRFSAGGGSAGGGSAGGGSEDGGGSA